MNEHDYPKAAIEAAVQAIRDIDETATYCNWSWDGTFKARQDKIIEAFLNALPVVAADDLHAEVTFGGKGRRCHKDPYKILGYYRDHLEPFFRSLEDRVNRRVAA